MNDWPPSRHDGPQASPGFVFWRRFMDWQRGQNAVLRPLGLTQPQFALLALCGWLTREGAEVTQAQVVAAAGMDKMHVSQILSRLEAAGLITRRAGAQDHRVKALELSEPGLTRLRAALPLVEDFDARFLTGP